MSRASVIEIDNLSYVYPGAEARAVDNVSFGVAEGECFGLLGPSGAGKSTLQRILTRQIRRYNQGSATVFGQDIAGLSETYYERIGVGFELPNHYPRLTGKENLQFFASLYNSTCRDPDELLGLVGLSDAADVRVSDYSKGMSMRLNFIRAIMHDPELLFLDEPTSGLDPVNARNLKRIVRDLQKQGKTIVLTTHNMHDVDELCDRVGFMVGGKMVALDEPEALKASHGERTVRVEYSANGTQGPFETKDFPLDMLGTNADFASLVDGNYVRTLHSQEASLDTVFASVTGVELGLE